MNVDNLRTEESIRKLIMALKAQKIDNACIQETHNERNDTYVENDYIIIFGRNEEDTHIQTNESETNLKAGAAISIKKTILPLVKGIYRTNGRIMEIRLKTGKSIKDISILNTYTPHTGYPIEYINRYWGKVKAYISLIPNKLIKIWRTDNNGQLCRNDANQTNKHWAMG